MVKMSKTPPVIVTPKGSKITPYKRYGVGKSIGGELYMHRSAAERVGLLDDVEVDVDPAYNTVIVKATGGGQNSPYVTFVKSPNFDTAAEPRVTDRITYLKETKELTEKPLGKRKPTVYHHKWLWVFPDYRGFNYDKAVERSKQILEIGYNPTSSGYEHKWDAWLEENSVSKESRQARTSRSLWKVSAFPASEGSFKRLNQLLSDEYVLFTKLNNYHWNVVGPQFRELHLMFEEQYDLLRDFIDRIAERIRALHGSPVGTLSEFLQRTQLRELEGDLSAVRMLEDLVTSHDTIANTLQSLFDWFSAEGDDGTADLALELQGAHDKMSWMLRASIS